MLLTAETKDAKEHADVTGVGKDGQHPGRSEWGFGASKPGSCTSCGDVLLMYWALERCGDNFDNNLRYQCFNMI